MKKSLFKSKTFWVNALTAVVTYAAPALSIAHIDPNTQAVVYAITAANGGLRILTQGPVAVLRDAATEP